MFHWGEEDFPVVVAEPTRGRASFRRRHVRADVEKNFRKNQTAQKATAVVSRLTKKYEKQASGA